MSCVSNRRRGHGRPDRGTASLEFALVGLAFFLLLFAALDLGRYFIAVHSLRTLTSELARATLVYCARTAAPPGTACALPASIEQSVLRSKTPFLYSTAANFTVTPAAIRSAANAAGVATITASASYDFSFVMPLWARLSGPISSSATLQTET